ncbi:MAG: hypothetical protein ACPLRH_00155 [Desulfotomaculales bacterium]
MLLRDWLATNEPPFYVSLFTMPLEGDPSEITAGQVHLVAHQVYVDDRSGTVIFCRKDGEAHIVLVEGALAPGVSEGGAWAGYYANLSCTVEGFRTGVMVVVDKHREEEN